MKKEDPTKQYIDNVNPCNHGHYPTRRYIKNNICVDCVREARNKISLEKRKEYGKTAYANKVAIRKSQSAVLITTLEAQLQFLQFDLDLPQDPLLDKNIAVQINKQVRLIQQALKHRSGDKWEPTL